MTKNFFCTKRKIHYSPNDKFVNNNFNLIQEITEKFIFNTKTETSNKEINANELVLIYDKGLNIYNLVELCKAQINDDSYIFGLDKEDILRNIKINQFIEYPNSISYNITCKHGTLSLSEHDSLLTVDNNLNIIKIPINKIKEGVPILIPRQINVIENDSPLDFSNCGEIIIENGIEYVKKDFTKAYRYVGKTYELGFILGQYCAEGSMKKITITCGNNRSEMEKVRDLILINFGLKPYIGIVNKEGYDTVYEVCSNTNLARIIFTKGLRLIPEMAPYKEIPSFLYNAPTECVKGFLAGFTEGDGSIGEYIRDRDFQSSPSRDVLYRLHSSSKKLIFGLNFLLKRFGVEAEFKTREFDNIKHPTWHNSYTLIINGRGNIEKLREFIPDLPEYGKFARDKEMEINLNPWMKKINEEMKRIYNLSLRMLVERKKIPFIAAKCSQEQYKKNISGNKLLKTLKYLIQNDYKTPTIKKLWKIFSKFTFTRVKEVEINYKQNKAFKLIDSYHGIYIAGTGQIFIN
ncbi:hypothetical protein LCGC14_1145240 [marine sediment metagenome]|uniref:DOD-type homing endonuclease domain-containing protein n=1 Tax=marine sediment metagenome TaxID=412755 RepID=A0A0F9M1V9_9ZZZZ